MAARLPVKIISVRAIIVAALLCTCRPPNSIEQSSKIQYAHSDGWENNTMLAVTPGSTLNVCDQGNTGASADVIRAVNEWAAAAGMGGKFTVAEGCGGKNEITIKPIGCGGGYAGYTEHFGVPGKWNLTYCSANYARSYDITLHEVGHMYGQCDRYGSGGLSHPVRGTGCADSGTAGSDGKYNEPSAMQAGGPNHPHRVTADDQNGLKALMARSDVRGASEWRKIADGGSLNNNNNNNNGGGGTTGSTGSTTGSTTGLSTTGSSTTGSNANSGCTQMVNKIGQLIPIFQQCDQSGICKFIQSALCG